MGLIDTLKGYVGLAPTSEDVPSDYTGLTVDSNVDPGDPVARILTGQHVDPVNPGGDPSQNSQLAALGYFGLAFVGTVAVGAAVGIYRMVRS